MAKVTARPDINYTRFLCTVPCTVPVVATPTAREETDKRCVSLRPDLYCWHAGWVVYKSWGNRPRQLYIAPNSTFQKMNLAVIIVMYLPMYEIFFNSASTKLFADSGDMRSRWVKRWSQRPANVSTHAPRLRCKLYGKFGGARQLRRLRILKVIKV